MGWNDYDMRSMRFSLVLPCIQLPLAVALWEWGRRVSLDRHFDTFYWPTPALLCYGINAPAVLTKLVVFPFTRTNEARFVPSVFGYNPEELAFFAGVIVTWFLIGRAIERRLAGGIQTQNRNTALQLLRDFLLTSLGVALFLESLQGFRAPWRWNNRLGNTLESTLFLLWSVVLISIPITQFVTRRRSIAEKASGR